jgi:hypothetical protein
MPAQAKASPPARGRRRDGDAGSHQKRHCFTARDALAQGAHDRIAVTGVKIGEFRRAALAFPEPRFQDSDERQRKPAFDNVPHKSASCRLGCLPGGSEPEPVGTAP